MKSRIYSRRQTALKLKKFEKLPDRGLRIRNIKIGSDAKQKLHYSTQENIYVTINYEVTKPATVYLGVSFRRTDDSYVAGYDTRLEMGKIKDKVGRHSITCKLPASQFAKDSYNVNASAFLYESNELLDFIDSAMGSETPTISILEKIEAKSGSLILWANGLIISKDSK